MQTFLPYASFQRSLKCLDNKRLGKQRVETLQILNALSGKSTGWVNHPATRMWRGYEEALKLYLNMSIRVWTERGFKNTIPLAPIMWDHVVFPHWVGWQEFHNSHKSNLLRKDSLWYSQFAKDVPDDLPYIWPKGA